MLPQTTQHDYAELALKRWPASVVSGSGPYAVQFFQNGNKTVRLFSLFTAAHNFAAENRGSFFDLEWYRRWQQPAPRFIRKPHWHNQLND